MKYAHIFLFLFFGGLYSYAQNMGIGTLTPHVKAKLHIEANQQGLLLPALNQSEEDILFSGTVPAGLMIYHSTLNRFRYYDGSVHTLPAQAANGDVTLTNSSRNLLNFQTAGSSLPNQEAGWKISLYDDETTIANRTGMGINSNALWFNVPAAGNYEWRHFPNVLNMRLSSDKLEITRNGAFVDGNLGVGIHQPTEQLHIVGNSKFTDKLRIGNDAVGVEDQSERAYVKGDMKITGDFEIEKNVKTEGGLNITEALTFDGEKPFLFERFIYSTGSSEIFDTGKSVDEYDAVISGFRGSDGAVNWDVGTNLPRCYLFACEILDGSGQVIATNWCINSLYSVSGPYVRVDVMFIKKNISAP